MVTADLTCLTSWQEVCCVVVMEFRKQHDTTDFCPRQLVTDVLRICYLETGVMDLRKTLLWGSCQFVTDLLQTLSLIPGQGACHRPNRLQEVHNASWVGRVHVAGGGGSACLRVGRTAQEEMLCCLVVASAVWAQWRLLSSDSV